MTFDTFDQSDEETWPDQQKDNDKGKHKDKDNAKDKYIKWAPSKSDPRDLWPLRHLIRVMRRHDLTKTKKMTKTNTKTMTNTNTNTFREHLQRANLVTCDMWDTDYISDNWEQYFLTIFVTWQLRVTLDSIHNSCDVLWIHPLVYKKNVAKLSSSFLSSLLWIDSFSPIEYSQAIP